MTDAPSEADREAALDQQRRKAVEWAASRWRSLTPEARAAIGDAAREHRRQVGWVEP